VLQEAGVPCEYHLYGNGGHGLACANEHYAKNDAEISEKIATWVPMATTWMNEIVEGR
jgi:acetyl esterase/lipase